MPIVEARFEQLRTRRGLTIIQLANDVGVGTNTIWRWLHGKSQPNAVRLARLAEVLETSSAYLIGDTDDPSALPRVKTDMTPDEFRLIDAFRRGDIRGAMRLLLGDDD